MHPFLQRSLLKAELLDASITLPTSPLPTTIPYHPSITRRSHEMPRSGNVGHRLYEEATRQAARLRDLETAAAREAETLRRASSIHSPEARRLRSSTTGSRRGGGGAKDVGGNAAAAVTRATDLLYRNALQLAKRKAALRAEVEAEARELSKPKMNE